MALASTCVGNTTQCSENQTTGVASEHQRQGSRHTHFPPQPSPHTTQTPRPGPVGLDSNGWRWPMGRGPRVFNQTLFPAQNFNQVQNVTQETFRHRCEKPVPRGGDSRRHNLFLISSASWLCRLPLVFTYIPSRYETPERERKYQAVGSFPARKAKKRGESIVGITPPTYDISSYCDLLPRLQRFLPANWYPMPWH